MGTGKSYIAGCIANALLDKGVPVMMTNFARLLNNYVPSVEALMDQAEENQQGGQGDAG